MRLDTLGLINWANLPNRNYSFEQVNMIEGPNGSGKTTLLDAIQTIMTSAYKGLFHYNPGQDESTQGSRTKEVRTLASYVLGADDGGYARINGINTCYLIANFIPELYENSPAFTAIIGVSAYLETMGEHRAAKQDDIKLFIIEGHTIDVNYCMEDKDEGGQSIVPLQDIELHLKSVVTDINITHCSGKEDYLSQLYGRFRGKKFVNKNEAKEAAKSFSKFMSYKPVQDLDQFIKRDVLDEKNIDQAIDEISSMMQSINKMEKQAQNIEVGVNYLNKANEAGRKLSQLVVDSQLYKYEVAIRSVCSLQVNAIKNSKEAETHQTELDKKTIEKSDLKIAKESVNNELRILQSQSSSIKEFQDKENIEKSISVNKESIIITKKELKDLCRTRKNWYKHLSSLVYVLDEQPDFFKSIGEDWFESFNQIVSTDCIDQVPFMEWVNSNSLECLSQIQPEIENADKYYSILNKALAESQDTINKEHQDSKTNYQQTKTIISSLGMEIERLKKTNQIAYLRDTESLLQKIRENFPDCDARVLCDHIEIKPDFSKWQQAIESLLKNNRFLILLPEEYESKVMDLRDKYKLFQSSVVQGSKLIKDLKDRKIPGNSSLYHAMGFTHQLADLYIKGAYGNVSLVESYNELRFTSRGLMSNGSFSSSYKMGGSLISEDRLVFGQEAIERVIHSKTVRLEELNNQFDKQNVTQQSWQLLSNCANNIKNVEMGGLIADLLQKHADNSNLEALLAKIDTSEFQDLINDIEACKSKLESIETKSEKLSEQIPELKALVTEKESLVKSLSKQIEEQIKFSDLFKKTLIDMSIFSNELDVNQCIEKIGNNTEKVQQYKEVNWNDNKGHDFRTFSENLRLFNELNIRSQAVDHKKLVLIDTEYQGNNPQLLINLFSELCSVNQKVDTILNQLRNDVLAKHRNELSEMNVSFNETFIKDICNQTYNAVADGKSQLQSLNQKLKKIRFGNEHYEFDYRAIPEFTEYLNLFEEAGHLSVIQSDMIVDSLTEASAEIFKKIRNQLLSEDGKGLKELKRIADYRNYHSFDIIKFIHEGNDEPRKVSLKRTATGSGGQLETPSYVIRSASLMNALRYEDSGSHLRMVLIDESFEKLDENRSERVINYLNKELGLQITMAIPSSKAGPLLSYVNKKFSVTKYATIKAIGELFTYVEVFESVINQDNVTKLFNDKKQQIYQDAGGQSDFLDLFDKLEQEDLDEKV